MGYWVEYRNNPTVCVVLLPWKDGVVTIRRGLADGYGKLALPGGFQNFGETMRDAAARELKEETGIVVPTISLNLMLAETDEFGHNVLFFITSHDVSDQVFNPLNDGEVLEVLPIYRGHDLSEIAYQLHAAAIDTFFQARDSNNAASHTISPHR